MDVEQFTYGLLGHMPNMTESTPQLFKVTMFMQRIKNEHEYEAALQEIDTIWGASSGTPDADRLDLLLNLVEAYEEEHYPIPLPDPLAAIEFHRERLGLPQEAIVQALGGVSAYTAYINGSRQLTTDEIAGISHLLGIATEVLAQPLTSEPDVSAS
jgi:HTH-type transcriptional regulator/antitoxin HigA